MFIQHTPRTQLIWDRYQSAASQIMSQYNIPSFERFVEGLKEQSETEPTEGHSNYRFANALLDMDETDVKDFYDFHKTLVILNAVSENELSEYDCPAVLCAHTHPSQARCAYRRRGGSADEHWSAP